MELNKETNELFHTGRIILIIGYTIFALMHVIITFLLGWDKWVLALIAMAVSSCWYLHIKSSLPEKQKLWIIALIMMCNYFLYGIHNTSTFDLAIVMAAIMMLFIMTGVKPFLTLCQITFYITFTYDLIWSGLNGTEFNILLICRITMHYSVITMLAYFLKTIINNWNEVINSSKKEIEELTESTERLNDFLANVSHEIRTPVNAIIGLSGICIEKEQNTDVKRDMEEVQKAGRRVSDQIGDILDFSEIDRGNIVKNNEDFMLSSAINDIMSDIREIRKDSVELVIDIDPNIPAVMNTDVTKLKKIIKALISNGIKYTNDGGVYLKINSEPQEYGVNLCIEVTDTGIGMKEDELEKVYERFYQSDSGRARIGGGLGLGLSIVSGFVALMGGFMTINSKPEVGTTVRISLPMKVVDSSCCMSISNPNEIFLAAYLKFDNFSNPMVRDFYNSQSLSMSRGLGIDFHKTEDIGALKNLSKTQNITHLFVSDREYMNDRDFMEKLAETTVVIVVAEHGFELPKNSKARVQLKPLYSFPIVSILNSGTKANRTPGSHMKLNGIHALVVDDEPMNLIVAKSIFKRYGMEVSTATSGQQSIDLCRDHKYDIIFMDHMMGNMDGVEAMKKIRSDVKGLNREVPQIALTANAMSSAKQMFLSEGFDGFVSKPIVIEELERTMKRILPDSVITYEVEEAESIDDASIDMKKNTSVDKIKDKAEVKTKNIIDVQIESKTEEQTEDDEVFEFGPGEETIEEASGDVVDDDEVFEFDPVEDDSEDASDDDEVFEFDPADDAGSSDDDEVLEFGPDDNASNDNKDDEYIKTELANIDIDMDKALYYLGGDPDLYREVILQFASEMDEKISKLNNYLENKDWKNYEIVIHAMKSSSKMIGAKPEVSEDAYELEKAAHNENAEYIEENHSRVIEVFKTLGEKILCLLA